MEFLNWFKKSNPAQAVLHDTEAQSTSSTPNKIIPAEAFSKDPIVNRVVNLLVDCSAEVDYDVKKPLPFTAIAKITQRQLTSLLNIRPNPYMNVSDLRRLLLLDYWMSGRAFLYWDGAGIYHLPEALMEVRAAESGGYIQDFLFDGSRAYTTSEIIYIKDNSYKYSGASQISGGSRFLAARNAIIRKDALDIFRENYLANGTVLGMILETEQVLNKNFKNRILEDIKLNYNTKSGKFAGSAFILDGGLKAKTTNQASINDLKLDEERETYNNDICTAFGVPPILLNSGNNSNVKPNLELLFYLTILPNLRKFESAFEHFFGYDLKLDTSQVAALFPDLDKQAARITALVNNGIITGDEGRIELRMEPTNDPQMTTIRIPANVSGSATGVAGQEGGAPTND